MERSIQDTKESKAHQYAQVTEVHGLQDALKANSKLEKICWMIILLGAIFFVLHGLIMTAVDYSKKPTSTHMEMIAIDTYPKLMYCQKHWINESKMIKAGFFRPDLDSLARIFVLPPTHLLNMSKSFENDQWVTFLNRVENQEINDLLSQIAHAADDVIISREPNNALLLTGNSSLEYFYTGYQPCLKVVPNVSYSPMTAAMSAFVLRIKNFSPAFGVGDRIHADRFFVGSTADSIWPKDGIHIVPGMTVSVTISALRLKRQNTHRYSCKQDPKEHYSICFTQFGNQLCQLDGMKQYYDPTKSQKLNEISVFGASEQNPENCNLTQLKDISWAWTAAKACSPPCDQWIFELTLAPLSVSPDPDGVGEIHISLHHPLEILQIEEVFAVTANTFLSNIGGQLGLWTGASLITFFHAAMFCIFRKTRESGKD